MIYGNCVKRVLDFSAALIVLAVLLVPLWVTTVGPNVDAFERELEEYLGETCGGPGVRHFRPLHLGLVMLGVGAGDEVLCQSMTLPLPPIPSFTRGFPGVCGQ